MTDARTGPRARSRRSTMTRRSDGGTPYARHLEIALLELERTRRDQERKAARRKLDAIESRLREIEDVISARQRELQLVQKS